MLPTRIVNTSGRSSSAIAARRPSAIAWSYSSRARERSFSSPSTTCPAHSIRIAVTAARSGSGKMYVASSGTPNGLRKPCVSSTLAYVPAMAARTSTASSGRLPWLVASAPRPASGSAGCPASSSAMSVVMSGSPRSYSGCSAHSRRRARILQQRLPGGQDFRHVVRARPAARVLEQQRHPGREPDPVHEPARGNDAAAIRRAALRASGRQRPRPLRRRPSAAPGRRVQKRPGADAGAPGAGRVSGTRAAAASVSSVAPASSAWISASDRPSA